MAENAGPMVAAGHDRLSALATTSAEAGVYSNRMQLPIPKKRFMCVEYPGGVKDKDKVIAALGGIDKVMTSGAAHCSLLIGGVQAAEPANCPHTIYTIKMEALWISVTRLPALA